MNWFKIEDALITFALILVTFFLLLGLIDFAYYTYTFITGGAI